MITITRKTEATVCREMDLPDDQRHLLAIAAEARKMAQAPYSRYFVGAAVRSESGAVYRGCNVERCSYSQTTHAEQNAVDTMVAAEGPVKIAALAVVATSPTLLTVFNNNEFTISHAQALGELTAPCAHCLQIILENDHGDKTVPLVTRSAGGLVVVTSIGSALPFPFGPGTLGIDYRDQRR